MATVKDTTDRAALVARLDRLTPKSSAQWGAMSAHQMVCHISDQMRVAMGDVECERRGKFVLRHIARWLVIHTPVRPPPGKVQTAPEMQRTEPKAWAEDMQTCRDLVARTATDDARGIHPTFGPLTDREWGILVFKHMDHHLRQFGV
jgi:hypothetical protein